jgi:molybdopterin converting factor small subunit
METGPADGARDETAPSPLPTTGPTTEPITEPITVRYWAAARAAAGVESDAVAVTGPLTLADVVGRVVSLHPGSRLPGVIEACSVLVGDEPVKSRDPATVQVRPGQIVEFLPPFAGG